MYNNNSCMIHSVVNCVKVAICHELRHETFEGANLSSSSNSSIVNCGFIKVLENCSAIQSDVNQNNEIFANPPRTIYDSRG